MVRSGFVLGSLEIDKVTNVIIFGLMNKKLYKIALPNFKEYIKPEIVDRGRRQTVNCRKVKIFSFSFFFQENRSQSLVSPFWLVLHHFLNPSGIWLKHHRYFPLFTP